MAAAFHRTPTAHGRPGRAGLIMLTRHQLVVTGGPDGDEDVDWYPGEAIYVPRCQLRRAAVTRKGLCVDCAGVALDVDVTAAMPPTVRAMVASPPTAR
jgi:hypothetical protein